ncbi:MULTISPECIES: class I SAM-dependent methyltransferase [Burkholderia]|uniref:class I SAM-dependent methyltransferase n=2 Tax=Burkholderia TaxID=32008 RepID=UPI0005724A4B|nr:MULTISPECIES: class I SAM-dependent methyltransferase [Burkholderia]ANW51954.1 hypothetical protein A7U58_07905 [Burkholderia pseudomallei]ANW57942.1 hypothetical protein A7U59_07885 [Burkholderia pseudomallei]MCT7919865.1 methyltransferase domain-containing protein [Burkholderia pseudomallei]
MRWKMHCSVCGGKHFSGKAVLWDDLINEWQISKAEVEYVNRQQGEKCDSCGSNLRSIALAKGILSALNAEDRLLLDVACDARYSHLKILEINEAGTLTPTLRKFTGYRYCAYPEVDMHALPFEDGEYDLIIHSDTLEHVANPVHALSECRRVLKHRGALCFTVPIIVGRMSRNRIGMGPSYHGPPNALQSDMLVHTEFGADAWTYVMEAGFGQVGIHSVAYPCATSIVAIK